MTRSNFFLIMVLSLLTLTGCDTLFAPTLTPDYTVKVIPAPDGSGAVAVPPSCPTWAENQTNPFDGQPLPQFGCANARNLALMVEQPSDLVKGRDLGPAAATTAVTAKERFDTNKTTPLLNPSADSATTSAH